MQTHSVLTHKRYAFSIIYLLLWIGLEVLYGFANYNLIWKPFLMVAGVKLQYWWGILI